MSNIKIRIKLLEYDKKLWWLADMLGISEATMSRRLRKELPEEEQDRICKIIDDHATETSKREVV